MVDPFQVLDNHEESTSSESVVDDAHNSKQNMNKKDSIENTFTKPKPVSTATIHNHSNDIKQNPKPATETGNNDFTDAQSIIMGGHSSNSEADLIVLSPPASRSSCNSTETSVKESINHIATATVNCAESFDSSSSLNKGAHTTISEQNIKNNLKQFVYKSNNSISCLNATTTSSTFVVLENHNDTTTNDDDGCNAANVCIVRSETASIAKNCSSSSTATTDCTDVQVTNNIDADNVISSSCTVRSSNVNSECLRITLNCTGDNSAYNKVESQQLLQQQQTVSTTPTKMDDNNHSSNSPTSTTESPLLVDTRKVEPLKINLHRDPIILKLPKPTASPLAVHDISANATVPVPSQQQQQQQPAIPKITIKQIPKPSSSHTSSSVLSSATTTGVIVTSENAAVLAVTTAQNNISRLDDYKV